MKIAWHGHSCFEIHNGLTVVLDPHDGRSIGIKPPVVRADICLLSHDHFDHNCSRIVRGDPTVIREPGERTVKGLKVLGIPTFHDTEGGAKRGRNTIYRFEMDGISFAHCGDLGHELDAKQLEALGKVDILFVPVGGVFTIDGATAQKLISKVRPRVAVPMHFRFGGLSVSIDTVDPFLEGIDEDDILRVGNEIEFIRDELPPKLEYWVFSP